jgi:hypothetical protein
MTDSALFIAWGPTYPGREHEARELFEETTDLFEKLVETKEIVSFEPVLLTPYGGDVTGFILVRGEAEQLLKLQMRPDIERLRVRAIAHHEKFFVIPAVTGEAVLKQYELFDDVVTELERKLVTV